MILRISHGFTNFKNNFWLCKLTTRNCHLTSKTGLQNKKKSFCIHVKWRWNTCTPIGLENIYVYQNTIDVLCVRGKYTAEYWWSSKSSWESKIYTSKKCTKLFETWQRWSKLQVNFFTFSFLSLLVFQQRWITSFPPHVNCHGWGSAKFFFYIVARFWMSWACPMIIQTNLPTDEVLSFNLIATFDVAKHSPKFSLTRF